MAHASHWPRVIATGLVLAACTGGSEQPAASASAAPPAAAPPAAQQAAPDTGAVLGPAMGLSREVFSYRGSGRDPFLSLLKSGDVRPFPKDVRVTGISFDPRYPQRSVATLQDTTAGRRYTVRVGDVIGRIRIVEIRATEVVAVVEEFGVDRPLVLPIRRRQEDTP